MIIRLRHLLFIPMLVNVVLMVFFGQFAAAAIYNGYWNGIALHLGLMALLICNAAACWQAALGGGK